VPGVWDEGKLDAEMIDDILRGRERNIRIIISMEDGAVLFNRRPVERFVNKGHVDLVKVWVIQRFDKGRDKKTSFDRYGNRFFVLYSRSHLRGPTLTFQIA